MSFLMIRLTMHPLLLLNKNWQLMISFLLQTRVKKIVGACIAGYDGHRGWLYAVAVSQSQRRKGTGTQLIKFAIEDLKRMGCNKVNLQIRANNTAVADFYKSLGFFIEDRLSMGVFI